MRPTPTICDFSDHKFLTTGNTCHLAFRPLEVTNQPDPNSPVQGSSFGATFPFFFFFSFSSSLSFSFDLAEY